MTDLTSSHTMLSDSTEDILVSVLKELGVDKLSNADLERSKAYVLIHKDNPDTKEMLGSVNIAVPIKIDSESAKVINDLNIPTDAPVLTCFGMFDAADNMKEFNFRCAIRNEHGYPLSSITDKMSSRTSDLNAKITDVIRKEVLEDLKSVL